MATKSPELERTARLKAAEATLKVAAHAFDVRGVEQAAEGKRGHTADGAIVGGGGEKAGEHLGEHLVPRLP